eukprot:GEZU01013381.1.p1 GENE.GEZU01013381.1~~GEZU01013381.1.p1  ORF type:complete len:138 (-),score=36.00 GEZU01013381.1:30-443(-)
MGRIIIELIEGKDLIAGDIIGTSDPYCIFQFGANSSNRAKNKYISYTLNPVWNQVLELELKHQREELVQNKLKVWVFDKDFFKPDDPLGDAELDLSNLSENESTDVWLALENVSSGRIHFKGIHMRLNSLDHLAQQV